MLCFDPHLEINRIPPFWYEIVAHLPGDDRIGISLPGLPGLMMGRCHRLAYGFTYGFMDMIDYYVEDIHDGQARRDLETEPVRSRQEWVAGPVTPSVDAWDLAGDVACPLSSAWSWWPVSCSRERRPQTGILRSPFYPCALPPPSSPKGPTGRA